MQFLSINENLSAFEEVVDDTVVLLFTLFLGKGDAMTTYARADEDVRSYTRMVVIKNYSFSPPEAEAEEL